MNDPQLGHLIACYWRPPRATYPRWPGGWYPVPMDRRGDFEVVARSPDGGDRVGAMAGDDGGRTMTDTYTAVCVLCRGAATLHVVEVSGAERVTGSTVAYYTGASLCEACAERQFSATLPRRKDNLKEDAE